jgi:hypothetical protein
MGKNIKSNLNSPRRKHCHNELVIKILLGKCISNECELNNNFKSNKIFMKYLLTDNKLNDAIVTSK